MNAEGTGLLLSHCRKAKAALVMSTVTVYKPHPDPWHPFHGERSDRRSPALPHPQPYSIVKIAEEAVARYCARAFDLAGDDRAHGVCLRRPRRTSRRSTCENIAAGEPVVARWDPLPYSPIHYDDINAQLEPLLGAASVPATIVNWAGDDAGDRRGVVELLRRAARGGGGGRGRAGPGRIGGLGRRRHQANVDHRALSRATGETGSADMAASTIPTGSGE